MISALLEERPTDIDFNLFEKTREIKFIEDYSNKYGSLPDKKVVEDEFEITLPQQVAPWQYYENKLKEEKYIKDALPILTNFNANYEKDQRGAIIQLRQQLTALTEFDTSAKGISIIRNTQRFDNFKKTDNTRLPTGIKPLDEASGGLSKKDEFMVVSARLGIGKSWVAHFIAKSMCEAGHKVGIYSGEMSEDEVGARMDSLISHISNFALTRGKDVDLTEHRKALEAMAGDILVLTPKQLRHNATPNDLRRFARDEDLDCIVIDQLSLMEPDGGKRFTADFERMALLSFQLKSLQQELQIPIVAVSQLNRGAAQQEADASNITGSDRIGQDATLILALARKEDTLKIKVLKARSFRVPDQPWEFTWDIDKGILEAKLSAMDAVKAKIQQAKAKEATNMLEEKTETQHTETAGDDEIW